MFPTSHWAAQIALGAVLSLSSLGLGFHVGAQRATPPKSAEPNTDDEDEGNAEDIADGDLSAIQAGFLEPCKLVLVVRTDLKMTPGKIAAQCGHATLACYKVLGKGNPKLVQHWERTGQAKIALKATSEDQVLELQAMAKSLNLCARLIRDGVQAQVLAIGPAPAALINEVTGKLRLL